jgi:ParB family transcriptional regulator, chromosome partitioning protein
VSVRDIEREHKELPLSLLDAPEIDLRMERDPDQLDKITTSIGRHGILQPLIVYRDGERFQIVDGFTRYLCANRAGLVVAPCYIYATRDAALEGVKYDTATMRLELSAAEEATFFHALFLGECGEDVHKLAARVGRSESYVDSRLQLLLGNDGVFDAVSKKQISLGVAQELNKIAEPDWCAYYLGHAISSGATRSVVSGWVTEYKNMVAARSGAPMPAVAVQSLANVAPEHNPLRCYICREVNNYIPIVISVHQHCQLAILDKLLAAYRGDAE